MLNFKQIRQRGAGSLRKMSDTLPKDTAMKGTVVNDSSKGGTMITGLAGVDGRSSARNPNTYLSNKGGSCGNPKNSDK